MLQMTIKPLIINARLIMVKKMINFLYEKFIINYCNGIGYENNYLLLLLFLLLFTYTMIMFTVFSIDVKGE